MAGQPFKEDFFERLVDVNWETEPEVFWMIGASNPTFVNAINFGTLHGVVWRSSDGKHWYGTDLFLHQGKGFGGFFTGCWMRKNLEKAAPPVWVLGGHTCRTQPSGAIGFSLDGETFTNDSKTVFDERHTCQNMSRASQSSVYMVQMNTFGSQFLHYDYYTSSDGQNWKPPNYHGGETDTFAVNTTAVSAATLAAPRTAGPPVRSTAICITHPDPAALTTESLVASTAAAPSAGAVSAVAMSAEITPFSTGTKKKGEDLVFIYTQAFATGKVRKGLYRGKRLSIAIDPYHNPPTGGAHGDNRVVVYDAKTGQRYGAFDCRVKRTISIGYGHYVFIVTGSNNKKGSINGNQDSALAWSEDGIKWNPIDLGWNNQINAIAVGPRPAGASPTPPKADEISIGGKLVGTGELPQPF